MDNFIINNNGVCINPIVEKIFSNKNFSIEVAYGCYNGKWAFGVKIDYNHPKIGQGGSGYCPSFGKHSDTFITKEDCKKAAFRQVLGYVERWNTKAKLTFLIDAVKAHFMVTQLSLFEF